MRWLLLVVALAACPNKPSPNGGSGGSGATAAGGCDGIRAKVEQLYRADAQARHTEPAKLDEAVADNTTMVMNDCAKQPAKVAACVSAASTIAELERTCLEPLDDEGREGEGLRR